jgi:hypothetical protein
MNKNLIGRNYRVAIIMLVIVAFGISLAAAPLGLPGGNVQIRVESGNLVLRGDDRDNNIVITENSIHGRAGTTVNGQRHRFIPDGVTNDVVIIMRGGNDFVRVELPGTNFALPHDLVLSMGSGNDNIELLQVKAPNETRINTGIGDDIVFIDGVLGVNEYIRPEFTGKFQLLAGSGDDLLEFHHTIFHGPVDVRLGEGIDGACSTQDSDFQLPDQTSFIGGLPVAFPGDGFVAPDIQLTNLIGFEFYPDDCSFLGGRY